MVYYSTTETRFVCRSALLRRFSFLPYKVPNDALLAQSAATIQYGRGQLQLRERYWRLSAERRAPVVNWFLFAFDGLVAEDQPSSAACGRDVSALMTAGQLM